ncbi:hypothetical protein QJS10_CPB20g00238 [Acorus calamus]|uniref:Uncharacterized protein n=1 Tax=Acorus calamus TaxID=4465 RepID=A0AAV9CAM4_ACOCL|nr:hypothetical protein QJS10_CPB20g00238 [Acorus calamus]
MIDFPWDDNQWSMDHLTWADRALHFLCKCGCFRGWQAYDIKRGEGCAIDGQEIKFKMFKESNDSSREQKKVFGEKGEEQKSRHPSGKLPNHIHHCWEFARTLATISMCSVPETANHGPEMTADWANILEDMLRMILKRVDHEDDNRSFKIVSKSWMWFARLEEFTRLLLSPAINHHDIVDHILYNSLDHTRQPLNLLDRVHRERCIGASSNGWLR